MSIFMRPDYESDTTQFLAQLKTAKPDLIKQQKEGLALLWNRPQNRQQLEAFKAARIKQNPYVYQNNA